MTFKKIDGRVECVLDQKQKQKQQQEQLLQQQKQQQKQQQEQLLLLLQQQQQQRQQQQQQQGEELQRLFNASVVAGKQPPVPRSAKNASAGAAVPVYEVPVHHSQKPVQGQRYRSVTEQNLREVDTNTILPTFLRRYCVMYLAHLQEITNAFIISRNGIELELAIDTDQPPCKQPIKFDKDPSRYRRHEWIHLEYQGSPFIIETKIITETGTQYLVFAERWCTNCHQV